MFNFSSTLKKTGFVSRKCDEDGDLQICSLKFTCSIFIFTEKGIRNRITVTIRQHSHLPFTELELCVMTTSHSFDIDLGSRSTSNSYIGHLHLVLCRSKVILCWLDIESMYFKFMKNFFTNFRDLLHLKFGNEWQHKRMFEIIHMTVVC